MVGHYIKKDQASAKFDLTFSNVDPTKLNVRCIIGPVHVYVQGIITGLAVQFAVHFVHDKN